MGLPDIAKNFVDLLISMLRAPDDVVSNVLETDMRPGDIRLWSKGEVEESPEESDTPMPVAFGQVLAFMETSSKDESTEYFDMLEAHIGACFRVARSLERYYGQICVWIALFQRSGQASRASRRWTCRSRMIFPRSTR